MPWTVPGEVEFGPVALTLTLVLLATAVALSLWPEHRRIVAAVRSWESVPDELFRFHRTRILVYTALLAVEVAVLATAVSLPPEAVGWAPVDLSATVHTFRSLAAVLDGVPPPIIWSVSVMVALLGLLALGVVAAQGAVKIWAVRLQRQAKLPFDVLFQAARESSPEERARAARAAYPRTVAQRRRATAVTALGEAETALRCYGIFPALLIGELGLPVPVAWAVLAAYFLLSYRPFAEDWREAALQAHVHVAAMALYLFFLPGSLLVPLLATAGNSLYTALSPVAGADPEGTAETPGTEEPR
ncbi:hypothetical protein FOF52_20135 [Thermobifida alba]|jgi:hypothetical protein|uniref:Uncharacterized protein n=1 Tax=Thermobifida alba TaxID=53522 RepID=A0ABY4LA21_THEAE|nr:hypothetical protein [Thermobifida alba]UPT22967.1 hypothetical protein FOF52_20135 [Thermobifida alba]